MWSMIRNIFVLPSPAEMLARQLAKAQRDRIESIAAQEEYKAHVAMLDARIARIQKELQAMTTNEKEDGNK